MSTRNFTRVFTREARRSPARFVEWVRFERAKVLLEDTSTDGAKPGDTGGG